MSRQINPVKRIIKMFDTAEFLCESLEKSAVNISPYKNGEWICGFNLITTWSEVFGANPTYLYWRKGDKIAENKIKKHFNKSNNKIKEKVN